MNQLCKILQNKVVAPKIFGRNSYFRFLRAEISNRNTRGYQALPQIKHYFENDNVASYIWVCPLVCYIYYNKH